MGCCARRQAPRGSWRLGAPGRRRRPPGPPRSPTRARPGRCLPALARVAGAPLPHGAAGAGSGPADGAEGREARRRRADCGPRSVPPRCRPEWLPFRLLPRRRAGRSGPLSQAPGRSFPGEGPPTPRVRLRDLAVTSEPGGAYRTPAGCHGLPPGERSPTPRRRVAFVGNTSARVTTEGREG